MEAVEDGCLVHGIYVDGAKLENGTLAEAEEKVLFYKTPFIQLLPCTAKPEGSVYQCPLYKTQERQGILSSTGHSTIYVLSIDIPTPNPSHWTKRGVAMLLDE